MVRSPTGTLQAVEEVRSSMLKHLSAKTAMMSLLTSISSCHLVTVYALQEIIITVTSLPNYRNLLSLKWDIRLCRRLASYSTTQKRTRKNAGKTEKAMLMLQTTEVGGGDMRKSTCVV